ncbi:MAG TPA: hypothetical protein VE954_00675 [Oligoflexus sp.]|uniref:hypothetical protein n=1 Tax=Oligoflexus sp. TaxID=1971216 RepID=UPI002D384A96|nr:hypothetical protein [Oligoflexus sp.]HYX31593.1 hypothetical protein [Oligoflexus sp.]
MKSILKKLKNLKPVKKTAGADDFAILPPFVATHAIYSDRLRMLKGILLAVFVLSAGVIGYQENRYQRLASSIVDKDFIIIPGAVDFMRVRPGLVPDNTVFMFAEYIAESMGTFNYANVEQRIERISQYMNPSFKETVTLEVKQKLPLYKELLATEIFIPETPTKYDLKKEHESGVPVYVVDVKGHAERYSGPQKIQEGDEIATITFRTTRIMPDRPWMFEITDIKRRTVQEYRSEQVAKAKLEDATRTQ